MPDQIAVEVVYALPERCWRFPLRLASGATVAEAIAAVDLASAVPGAVVDPEGLAIHGQAVPPGTMLRDGDRIEVLRPLEADPKLARRRRAAEAGKG